MPSYIRWREDGAAYFFTLVTYHRRAVLAAAYARIILKRAMAAVRQRWLFHMPACVLLSDHLHCIWQLPEGDDDFPVRWANIKRLFTQRYLASGGCGAKVSPGLGRHRQRGVWQPRYWEHRIRYEED
jgi:putative transposase